MKRIFLFCAELRNTLALWTPAIFLLLPLLCPAVNLQYLLQWQQLAGLRCLSPPQQFSVFVHHLALHGPSSCAGLLRAPAVSVINNDNKICQQWTTWPCKSLTARASVSSLENSHPHVCIILSSLYCLSQLTLGNSHTNPLSKYARAHPQLSWGVGRCHCAAPLSLGHPPVTLNWLYYSCNHSVGIFLRMRSEPRAEI